MAKKKTGGWRIAFGITLLLVVFTGLALFVFDWNMNIRGTSLSNVFHGTIDPLNPNYIHNTEVACADFNGDFYDTSSKIGCFNMGTEWDATHCFDTGIRAMQNLCESLDGADWICDANNVGCSY